MKGLNVRLLKYGVTIGEDSFKSLVAVTYRNNHQGQPVDRFLCDPDAAIEFASLVADTLDAPNLPDRVILETLLNLRKQGLVKAGKS
jgi:hypothetical protein